MIKRPINYIFLEGPDLSGKTTLYESIHKSTGYRWNIQDRSALSMLVHAKYYERDTFRHVEQLKSEIYNLNNVLVILLPEWSEIARRFNERGDPIQNITSLMKIYKIFEEAVDELRQYPNVIVLRNIVDDESVKYLTTLLKEYENAGTRELQQNCLNSASASEKNECIGLNFTIYDDTNFEDIDEDDLMYEEEVDYYNDIITDTVDKIKNELAGNNEYERKETPESRRFIYSSDTCISLGHFLVRGESLDCQFFFRSSNVKDTLYYDINFIKYFVSQVYKTLGLSLRFCKIQITINSAHILLEG